MSLFLHLLVFNECPLYLIILNLGHLLHLLLLQQRIVTIAVYVCLSVNYLRLIELLSKCRSSSHRSTITAFTLFFGPIYEQKSN